ncbi:fatty acyl-CoA reductase 1-like [Aricia agestis]|uniref:fatty acyl-CoA reductase 1-like n=1 Tax=Aricia agestis TaxID=91739 RepID=UPI001C203288|nr:fatty acyl-CoA reductase 1-like [Aricia agestis]
MTASSSFTITRYRLRKTRPGIFEAKVCIVPGDVSKDNLGISEQDRAMLINTTNIVFHSAASVRFDEPLKAATRLNLLGTKQMLDLAKEMTNFESFVHVSTTYCNTHRARLEERLYTPHMDWRQLLGLLLLDDETVRHLTPKLLGDMANTYVVTKHLAEHMASEERGRLPVIIMKPSIMTASLLEPVPGWIDNFNGPVGLLLACGTGVVRVLYTEPDVTHDYVPADLVVRALIVGAWLRGTKKLEPTDDVPLYNTSAAGHLNVTPREMRTLGAAALDRVPLDSALWTPCHSITSSTLLYYFHVFFVQLLLGVLIDTILRLLSKPPRLVKIYRRVFTASLAVKEFTMKQWTFSVDNLLQLRASIKEQDKEAFDYIIECIPIVEYFTNSIVVCKRVMLNEDMDNLPRSKAYARRLSILDKVIKALVVGVILWCSFTSHAANSCWLAISDYIRLDSHNNIL